MGKKALLRRKLFKELILSRRQPPGVFPFVLILDHMKPTFNIGKIIRTANAFGVREVHLIGIPSFNIKPCAGTLAHTRTLSLDHFRDSYLHLEKLGYAFFALDRRGSERLGTVEFPPRSAFIIGHEEYGLSFDLAEYPMVRLVQIPQFGQVESLNASVAASVATFEYLRQHDFSPKLDYPYGAPEV